MRRRRDAQQMELRRTLACAGAIFAVLLLLAVILFVVVPFRVNLQAEYDQLEGNLRVADTYGNSLPLENDTDRPIEPGETIMVEAGSTVRVELIEGSNAFAFLIGAAEWTLESAWRNATLLNHVANNGEDYRIVINQTLGTATYNLSQSNPSFDKLNLTIRFPDRELKPTTACFQATVGTPSTITEIACETEVVPMPAPTLPSLP